MDTIRVKSVQETYLQQWVDKKNSQLKQTKAKESVVWEWVGLITIYVVAGLAMVLFGE